MVTPIYNLKKRQADYLMPEAGLSYNEIVAQKYKSKQQINNIIINDLVLRATQRAR